MAKIHEFSYSLDQIKQAVCHVRAAIEDASVVTLTGSLGAGKTTLVTQLLRSYGVSEEITSPTFTYVNVYHNAQGKTFYHFDLYRISSLDEFLAAGFDEYLYQPESIAFIEWPEVIMPLLTHAVCHITLDYGPDMQSRLMKISCIKKGTT